MVAVPAMLGAVAIIDRATVRRIGRAFEKLFDEIDGIVQVPDLLYDGAHTTDSVLTLAGYFPHGDFFPGGIRLTG